MNYYLRAFENYTNFKGRDNLPQYWYFALINAIIVMVLNYLIEVNILSILYSLIVFIPGLAISVRRLHDIGKSGWWTLIGLIPFVGWVWIIILLATKGQSTSNKYGAAL